MTPDLDHARVCIVGNLLTDLIVTGVSSLPRWGQEVAGTAHRSVTSGQAGYLAQGLLRLGVPADVIAVVGDDAEGTRILADLDRAGVGTGSIAVSSSAPTAVTVAVVRPDGERAFVSDFACLSELDEDAVL